MADLKRYDIKYIRDYMKKSYKAREACFVCGSTEKLELHHLYCVSELFEQWRLKNGVRPVTTVEEMKDIRVRFAEDYAEFLGNDQLYTLCKTHHMDLHSIYGKSYAPSLANKVKNWLEIKREKHGG